MGDPEIKGSRSTGGDDYSSSRRDDIHQSEEDSSSIDELLSHEAVLRHGIGITSEQLADFVDVMCMLASERVLGVGAEQYDEGGRQKFEDMSEPELRQELIEELLDVVVYASMLALKVAAR